MSPRIIAISGKSGCGNTTVSRLVAGMLGIRIINYTFRSMAQEMGLPFGELLSLAEADFSFDKKLDLHQVELAHEEDCVIGSRLAMWLLPDATLRVYLRASPESRAARIHNREGGTLEEVMAFTSMRDSRDHARYLDIYGIDNDDFSSADLVINTDKWEAQQIAALIVQADRSMKGRAFPEGRGDGL